MNHRSSAPDAVSMRQTSDLLGESGQGRHVVVVRAGDRNDSNSHRCP